MTCETSIHVAGGEVLFGATAIAQFLGIRPRQVYHLVQLNALPYWKEGKTLVARRTTLRSWVDEREAAGCARIAGRGV